MTLASCESADVYVEIVVVVETTVGVTIESGEESDLGPKRPQIVGWQTIFEPISREQSLLFVCKWRLKFDVFLKQEKHP